MYVYECMIDLLDSGCFQKFKLWYFLSDEDDGDEIINFLPVITRYGRVTKPCIQNPSISFGDSSAESSLQTIRAGTTI